MPPIPAEALESLLCTVEKPVRYIGNEWNSIVQDGPDIDFRIALAYPDSYEIGMSHLGFRILYSLLNAKEGVAAERVFAPWPDLEAALRERELPLYSLETKRPLGEFEMLGFSLQYEMTLSNVLTMLDLAGIPAFAEDRVDGHPLILAGGPVALNPEPFADFFDLIAIGDGEELLPELIERHRELRAGGASRAEIVSELGQVPGVYAPAFYELETDEATGLQIVAGSRTHPFPVKRRILMDLGRHPFPQDIIVPFCEIVHSRVAVEVMRGCNVGCRFCQAGYIYRPERVRTPEQVLKTAFASSESTGFDEVSLTSLNTGEYPEIEGLVTKLMDRFETSTTAVSLPSLRASSLKGGLLDEIDRVRKSGLTIAPECGTQRMRDVINKNITEEDIESAAEAAFSHGWNLIKLYFMIGQPTEREADVVGIPETARKVFAIGRKHRGGRAKVNLGVSSFIPKPFTPFQWMPMEREETLREKQKLIVTSLGRNNIKFGRHDVSTSILEAAFSRGDRRLAKAYLKAEWEKALKAEVVSICSGSDCHGCGSFVKECLSGNASHGRDFPERDAREASEKPPAKPSHVYRVRYEKSGWTRFISHLDLARTLRFTFRRAGLELAFSEGFHPKPKVSFGPPLPLGTEGRAEVLDMSLKERLAPEDLLARLNAALAPGLRVTDVWMPVTGDPKISRSSDAARYSVQLSAEEIGDLDLEAALAELLSRETIPIERKRKGIWKPADLRPGILSARARDARTMELELRILGAGNARPDEVVRELLGAKVPGARIVRECLLALDEAGGVADLLRPPAKVDAA